MNKKTIISDVDKNTTEIKSHMQAFDDVKRTLVYLKQLEKTVGKSKMSHENLHKEFTCFKSKVDNGCLNISRLHDKICMGVSAIKSKVQITNTKVKDIEESLVELTTLIKSVTTSTTDMRKRVTSLEKELKHYSTKKSYSEVIVSNNSSETSITRTVNNDKSLHSPNTAHHTSVLRFQWRGQTTIRVRQTSTLARGERSSSQHHRQTPSSCQPAMQLPSVKRRH